MRNQGLVRARMCCTAEEKRGPENHLRPPTVQELLASDVSDLNPFNVIWPACLKLPAVKKLSKRSDFLPTKMVKKTRNGKPDFLREIPDDFGSD